MREGGHRPDPAAEPQFRIIDDEQFQAFSREEKLAYLRSAIEAHARFAPQPKPGADGQALRP